MCIRFAAVIGVFIFSGFALMYLSSLLYPFIIGAVIALLINPIASFLEKRFKMHRGAAVILSLLVLLGAIAGALTLLIQELITGFAYLANDIPQYSKVLVFHLEQLFKHQILPMYQDILSLVNQLNHGQQTTIMENIEKLGDDFTSGVTAAAHGFIDSLSRAIVSLPSFLTIFIFSLLASFFISKDWNRLTGYMDRFLPDPLLRTSKRVYAELQKAMFGFIKAQITLISITACIVLTGLLILRVEYAITISMVIGLVDLLPYLGTGAVFLPWIAYAFFSGDYTLTIGLSVLYGIVVIQRQVMEPKILSSNIGLDPLATLIALFAGFQWFGFLGLIIGPVLLIIIRALYEARFFHEIIRYVTGKPVQ
ncbi:sporulation integral membrane protein YtvI [Fictibacillus aquaticus]|jgi:sporulation integral membrane protein YtvI|uniref:Sporulation integral membrane protein YtvI n=2 Tax=Fictibacillus aquaticus TaxID=2021314 RepID=A0A235FAK6_9BACL|nr:sporulation integral membrane protein YtvI [Fictibacillus aquaticus]